MTASQATVKNDASASPSSTMAAPSSTATIANGRAAREALTAAASRWAESRGIKRETLAAFGVSCAIEGMQGLGRVEVICFPYRRGAETVNVKYRAIADKAFKMREGGILRFWNLDAVLNGDRNTVYIFEGEMDALAAAEAGIPQSQILSAPNGAPKDASEDAAEHDRYRYVISGLEEGLSTVKRFIIATDNDGPGRALRQDLVNMLGAARCWFVDWPQTVKDANELLMKGGPGELLDCLQGDVKEWPVDGLYKLSELPEPPPLETWDVGFPGWEKKLRLAARTLCIFTGHPGHGKTHMTAQLVFNVCRRYNVKAAIATFETEPKPHYRRLMRRFMFGKMDLTDDECAKADRWTEDHIWWIAHRDRRPSFRWFMDMAEVAVIRHGVKIIILDPWNKVEADRPDGVRETDWIRDRLNELMNFAKTFGVLVMVLAHPAKRNDERSRDRRPELEDIAGSKHWDNIPDQGLSIYRPKVFDNGVRETKAKFYHLKTRIEELGYECRFDIECDLATGRFRSVDDNPALPSTRAPYRDNDD